MANVPAWGLLNTSIEGIHDPNDDYIEIIVADAYKRSPRGRRKEMNSKHLAGELANDEKWKG